ncbi:hypothetical protein ACH5RR_006963 [Cinchona calisaya]|uniref:non-specific serine/threonine protein kinase n=1 Tax=Cinchona calisaya TaxID=153742 RepID=A0ABD3AQW1_9GENT
MEGRTGQEHRSYRSILSNYRLGKTLGVGAFAKVKLAVHNMTGIKVAIKILDRQTLDESETMKVKREINIMTRLSHPHIVRLFEVIETTSHIYVVMEYMNSGELFYYITEKGRVHEDEARHLFQQIISGIEYCHCHMVVHRDLKPENLLLDSKRNVKIADFGLGNIMRDGHFLKTSCGSPNYAAPEVVANRLYAGPEADVWSCGVILYALICGRLPFDDDNIPGLYARIRNGNYPVSNHMSRSASDLIARIFVVNPVNRISIPEIRQHPWFQEHVPQYIASATIGTLYDTTKVDEEVVREMVKLGFDIGEVIECLLNHLQNEITVTYYLLLHRQFQVRFVYDKSELLESSSQELLERTEIFLRSVSTLERKWTLGFKSQASPHQTMMDVLKVFHRINVKWKQVGPYNMKCLWEPPCAKHLKSKFVDQFPQTPQTKCIDGKILPSTAANGMNIRSDDSVKFELQLYRGSGEMYVVDLQWLNGPPFLFLEICASFLFAVGVI